MVGGLFNTLAAPFLFDSIVEYPLMVLLGCLMFRASVLRSHRGAQRPTWSCRWSLGSQRIFRRHRPVHWIARGSTGVVLGACAHHVHSATAPDAIWIVPSRALLLASLAFGNANERVLYATRTFFGVYRVSEDRPGRYHGLAHGTTLHGMQALAPARRREALTYFHETGPFGQAWNALPRMVNGREIAVVGLGVGTLATVRAARTAVDVLRNRPGHRDHCADAGVFFVHGGLRRSLPRGHR